MSVVPNRSPITIESSGVAQAIGSGEETITM
jgi:hypothetical protein